MRSAIRALGLGATLALAACVQTPEPAVPGLSIVPAAQGLLVAGTRQEISFGRTQASTIDSVTRLLGREPDLAVLREGCPGGPFAEARWSRDGLSLYFVAGDFVGWRAGGGRRFADPPSQAGRVCP